MVKKAKEEANKATGEMKHQRMWRSPTPSGHFQKDLRSFCHRSPGVTRHKRFQMTVNDNRTSSLIVVDNERISIRRQSGGGDGVSHWEQALVTFYKGTSLWFRSPYGSRYKGSLVFDLSVSS